MSGILLITGKGKRNGNIIFRIECEPDQVQENIDRVVEFAVYDFAATYNGKPVEGAVPLDWMDRHADKIQRKEKFSISSEDFTWDIADE